MIYELRIYTCVPGSVDKVLRMWESEGQLMLKPYFTLKGQWVAESGVCNQIYSLWEFETMDHRNEMRKQLLKHPGFMDYLERCRAYYVKQESIFLSPTAISPMP